MFSGSETPQMDGIQDWSEIQDLGMAGAIPTGGALFDASQYAFFGGDAVEEVELGGLDDDDDDLSPAGFEEERFPLEKDERDDLEPLSEIEDLSKAFSETNKVVNGPTNAEISRNWGSQESSSASTLPQDEDFINWYNQRTIDSEANHGSRNLPSQQYTAHFVEPTPLYRTSSYPEQQQNLGHHYSSEPILIPKPPTTSYPLPSGRPHQFSPNGQSTYPNIPYHPTATSPNLSPLSNSQLQFKAVPSGPQFGGMLPQLPHGLPGHSPLQNQWMSQKGLHPVNIPNKMSPQNGTMGPQLIPHHHSQQIRSQHPFQPSPVHLAGQQSHLLNPQFSTSQHMLNNFDMLGLPDLRDQRAITMLRSRQGMHYPHQGLEPGNLKNDGGRPRFRSKYMTSDEIENINRMQHAATHSSNPYVDDYYYQACLARKSSGARLKHHFCPIHFGDRSSNPRANNEPHSFLPIDALGRISFSSVNRPRPILEIDSPNPSNLNDAETKYSKKPFGQEPMLSARATIADGFSLLLDVDDIDRFLHFNQLPDGGTQLRERRQVLLERLVSSFQLVDPMGKHGGTLNVASKDEIVFLRVVSLPKGRKLLLRYFQLLLPSELSHVVSMAIFRNLRFLFGYLSTDTEESMISVNLAKTVASGVHAMELKYLAACLASVVCSAEHPPMRPIGSPAGDGASVILKSILERGTKLLTDPHAAGNCAEANRAFWQASFDAFFKLLLKYCLNKYESVAECFVGAAEDMAKSISREMPVELLRASLPHMNEQQKKLLLEFAHRSMPVMGFSGGNGSS